jgi:hypothetical protein
MEANLQIAAQIFEPLDLTRRIYRKDSRREGALAQERLVGILEQESIHRHDREERSTSSKSSTATRSTRCACRQRVVDRAVVRRRRRHPVPRPRSASCKEELQSTNEELDATNRELAHRTEEMNRYYFSQRTIIRSLSSAVMVVDAEGRHHLEPGRRASLGRRPLA